ncbi:MAG: hypothetical protein P9M14_04260 [Candidatus Alcyoniella australis]|nr:hypothetical protein [Candidatus Alcyoniella australis]
MSDEPHLLESYRNPIFLLALLVGAGVVITAVGLTGISEFGPFKLYTHWELLQAEGRGVELAEMLCYLATFALSTVLAVKISGKRARFALYGAYFFVLAMEESDWLQQVLGYDSPQFFVVHNKFDAVNIHNLLMFGEGSSVPVGQYWALAFLLTPLAGFLLYSLVRAWRGEFLGKVALILFGFAFFAECIPSQPVLQLLLGIFALAYAAIVATVDSERRRRTL